MANIFNVELNEEKTEILIKIATIILLVFIFILLMYLGSSLIIYFHSPKKNPYLINGMVPGNKKITINQNPNEDDSVTILRSVNEDNGIEFTWSVWLYVNSPPEDDYDLNKNKFKHIFHKGNLTKINNEGIFIPNNAPGLYFKFDDVDGFNNQGDDMNLKLYIYMNTYKNILEKMVINEIPLEKWLHVAVRLKDKKMDVFINGQIVKRKIFSSIAKQNYDNVHIANAGGFDGNISDLRYFSKALTGNNIISIVNNGPNLRMENKKVMDYYPPYFSINWFLK